MNLRLSVELRPLRVKLSHFFHHVVGDIAFFLQFEEDAVEFVMDRSRGVFLKSCVAARGFNVVVDFVYVLLGGKDDCSVAFVCRKEFEVLLLGLQGLQCSSLLKCHVVRVLVCLRVVGGEDFNNLMGSREFHAFREALQGVLDPGSKVGGGILSGSGYELESKVENIKFASGELFAGEVHHCFQGCGVGGGRGVVEGSVEGGGGEGGFI